MCLCAYVRMCALCMDFKLNERNKDAKHKYTVKRTFERKVHWQQYISMHKYKQGQSSEHKPSEDNTKKGVSYLISGPASRKADRQTLKHSGKSAQAGVCVWVGRKGRGSAERVQGRTGGCAGRSLTHTHKPPHETHQKGWRRRWRNGETNGRRGGETASRRLMLTFCVIRISLRRRGAPWHNSAARLKDFWLIFLISLVYLFLSFLFFG